MSNSSTITPTRHAIPGHAAWPHRYVPYPTVEAIFERMGRVVQVLADAGLEVDSLTGPVLVLIAYRAAILRGESNLDAYHCTVVEQLRQLSPEVAALLGLRQGRVR